MKTTLEEIKKDYDEISSLINNSNLDWLVKMAEEDEDGEMFGEILVNGKFVLEYDFSQDTKTILIEKYKSLTSVFIDYDSEISIIFTLKDDEYNGHRDDEDYFDHVIEDCTIKTLQSDYKALVSKYKDVYYNTDSKYTVILAIEKDESTYGHNDAVVIAEINNNTGEITYFDKCAENDIFAQEEINKIYNIIKPVISTNCSMYDDKNIHISKFEIGALGFIDYCNNENSCFATIVDIVYELNNPKYAEMIKDESQCLDDLTDVEFDEAAEFITDDFTCSVFLKKVQNINYC